MQQYVFLLDPSNHMGKNLTVYGMNLRLILTNTIKKSEKYLYFIFPSEEQRGSDVTIFFGKNHHKSFICQKAIKQYRRIGALSSHYDAPWWHTDGCRTSAIAANLRNVACNTVVCLHVKIKCNKLILSWSSTSTNLRPINFYIFMTDNERVRGQNWGDMFLHYEL